MQRVVTDPAFDTMAFRQVMGHYPTGVVVVTGVHPDGERLAMVVGTFTSVSLDPALVAFLPMKSSRTFIRLSECDSMCVNVLTGDQEAVARTIASRDQDRLDGLEWFPSPSGSPILADSLAWIDVRLKELIDAGDHSIALCSVIDLAVTRPKPPLIFFQGGYGRFAVPSLVARIDDDIIGAVQDAVNGRHVLESLAEDHACEVRLLTVVNRDELADIASAVGPGVSPTGLGLRSPIVPPIADVWVAEQPEEEQEYWLRKAGVLEGEALVTLRARLDFARAHGYLMSFLPAGETDPYEGLREATRRYTEGSLTPTEERQIRQTIAASAVNYGIRPIVPDEVYDIGMFIAPVHDPHGRAVHLLRMSQLPPHASGVQVQEWVKALKESVAKLEDCLFHDGYMPATHSA